MSCAVGLEAETGSTLRGYEILVMGSERLLVTAPNRAADMLMTALRAASIHGDMDRVVRAGRLATRLVDDRHGPASARFAAEIAELLTGTGAVLSLLCRRGSAQPTTPTIRSSCRTQQLPPCSPATTPKRRCWVRVRRPCVERRDRCAPGRRRWKVSWWLRSTLTPDRLR